MKILMVSMHSLHFFRWVDQLKDSGHEVWWLDVLDSGKEIKRISWVYQVVGWRRRWDFPGRDRLKSISWLNRIVEFINNRSVSDQFKMVLDEFQPDIVHSFAWHLAAAPIVKVMEVRSDLKWVYSSWGSDLFLFQHDPQLLPDMKRVLQRIDGLFTDCLRDRGIAETHSFKGKYLGCFPGGGGYHVSQMQALTKPWEERDIILIKGYQGVLGRAMQVIEAMMKVKISWANAYSVIVFGADSYVEKAVLALKNNGMNIDVVGMIGQQFLWELMGKSRVYIGNSSSDGIPNALLEALIMGVYPIQSDPGGATSELLDRGYHIELIHDPEDINSIAELINRVLSVPDKEIYAMKNMEYAALELDRDHIQKLVISAYDVLDTCSVRSSFGMINI